MAVNCEIDLLISQISGHLIVVLQNSNGLLCAHTDTNSNSATNSTNSKNLATPSSPSSSTATSPATSSTQEIATNSTGKGKTTNFDLFYGKIFIVNNESHFQKQNAQISL